MTELREPISESAVRLVRRGLLALTLITICATAFELATVHHWNDLEQLIPWVALSALTVATISSLLQARWAHVTVRILAILVVGASIYGVIDHVLVNYDSGPLDQRFADTWDGTPMIDKWWYAITKTVGPSPTLAPGVLGLGGVLLLFASLIDTRPFEKRSD